MRWIWVLPCVWALAAAAQPPAGRPEFEVASIKPSPPTQPQQVDVGLHIDGAQVHISYLPLKDYIRIAYRVRLEQVSGPAWIDTERFDVSAKLADGAPRDKIPEMLQSLLEDRFGLKVHTDSKEFPVYALLAGSSGVRLKESAAEANPTGALDVGGSGSANGVNVNLGRGSYFSLTPGKLEARKLTMAQFADVLTRFVDRTVVDMTHVEGSYDVSMPLTPEDYRALLIQSAVKAGVTLEPSTLRALEGSTHDSLSAGLAAGGLKLDARKAPMEVVVVDQVKKSPGDN